jgi:UDP-N-acetyl-D-glucosamine dehydrogenase
MKELFRKIIEKQAMIGIIGLGHTGLSLAHDFGTEGFNIVGYDIDTTKIEKLRQRESYLPFLPLGHLFYLLDENKFKPTSDVNDLAEADVIIISVPTPLNQERQPDITFLCHAVQSAAQAIKKKNELVASRTDSQFYRRKADRESTQLIVIQSTSYPGTTEEEALPILENYTALKVGEGFFLAHVPEREDAGNPSAVLKQIPRICGGVTPECTLLAKALYEHITVKVHACSSARVAEAAKTYENTFRLINIAFVDEMKMAFDKMGINIWEVIEACSTKPFGFTPFYPGPGIGGECIPVDPVYLSCKAKQVDAETSIIDASSAINIKISEYVVLKIEEALLKKGKKLTEAKILILGVAFKKDVSDIRESPSLRVLSLLKQKNAHVAYHDPFVPHLTGHQLFSIHLDEEALSSYDCVAILTDHSRYDWNWICQNSHLIVDTRYATKDVDQRLKSKIVM